MAWIWLFFAGVFECVWAVAMKYSHGFTRFLPGSIVVLGMAASTLLLALAVKHLPLGTAYAVWTGLGALGTALCGIILFHEPATAWRIVSLVLIFCGIVGLKLFSK